LLIDLTPLAVQQRVDNGKLARNALFRLD
jgi:hypothetical protein